MIKRLALSALLIAGAAIAALSLIGLSDAPEVNVPGAYADVLGERLRYAQRGSGHDLLLIHGSPGSIEDWQPIVDRLIDRYRVTTYDRPGNGYSSATRGRYDYAGNAEVASGLIATLGLHDVLVVGHSYGGGTALAMALGQASDVKGYVVVDSAAYQRIQPSDPFYHLLNVPALGNGVAKVLGASLAPNKIRQGILRQFPTHPPDEAFIGLRTRIWSQPKVMRSVARESTGTNAELAAMSPRYKDIAAPLVVVAEADNARRRESAERLAHDVAGAELVLVPDTGHYVQFEQPDQLAAIIARAADR